MAALIPVSTADAKTYKGTMTKRVIDMTAIERADFYKEITLKARERLFAIGQPWIYEKNGQVVAEYADGSLKVLQ